jgi:hypothetical protein
MADAHVNSWDNSQMLMPLYLNIASVDSGDSTVQTRLTYEAKRFRQLTNAIYKRSGVIDESDFTITAGTSAGTIDISPGAAVVYGGSADLGAYLFQSTAAVTGISVPASVGSGLNTMRVSIQAIDKADNPDSSDPDEYGWRFVVTQGLPGIAASPPVSMTIGQLTRTGTGAISIDQSAKLTASAGGGTAWHNFSSFSNTWTAYGSSYAPPRYRRTNDGVVFLDGMVKAGSSSTSGSTICTLPVGFRPAYDTILVATGMSNSVLKGVRVHVDSSAGHVLAFTGDTDSTFVSGSDWVSFGGLNFVASGY